MSDPAQFDDLINNTSKEIQVNQGRNSGILPDGDVTVEFWNEKKAAFTGAIAVDDTGSVVFCTHDRMRITTTSAVHVRVVREKL